MALIVDRLRPDELQQMFSDWSTQVIVQRVDQGLDSDFDDISESETNFEIEAVLLPVKSEPTSRTGMQHFASECDFMIRADDVPAAFALSACRLLAAGRKWSVTRVTRSADGRVVQLRGQAT
jgi:hypothetical protein